MYRTKKSLPKLWQNEKMLGHTKQFHRASKNTNDSKNILAKCLETTIFEKQNCWNFTTLSPKSQMTIT